MIRLTVEPRQVGERISWLLPGVVGPAPGDCEPRCAHNGGDKSNLHRLCRDALMLVVASQHFRGWVLVGNPGVQHVVDKSTKQKADAQDHSHEGRFLHLCSTDRPP